MVTAAVFFLATFQPPLNVHHKLLLRCFLRRGDMRDRADPASVPFRVTVFQEVGKHVPGRGIDGNLKFC